MEPVRYPDMVIGKDTTLGSYNKGGTRKIADAPPPPCNHPEHNPAGMIVREPGTYEHICPSCGRKFVFNVSYPTL